MCEIWKDIEPGYQVSSFGRVKGPRCLLKQVFNDRYFKVSIGSRTNKTRRLVYVHHLVCEAFHGKRPSGMYALHNDGDTTNNRSDNLRWGTATDNMKDRELHGNHLISGVRKLAVEQVKFIRSEGSKRFTRKELADQCGVDRRTIKDVVDRRTFTYVEG